MDASAATDLTSRGGLGQSDPHLQDRRQRRTTRGHQEGRNENDRVFPETVGGHLSPARQAAGASRSPGRSRLAPVSP